MLNRLSYYIDELRSDDKIDYDTYLNLREMSDQLGDENETLRRRLIKAAKFALGVCGEDECSGDESAGLFPCEMWEKCEDEGGRVFGRCFLEHILAELKGGKQS